MHRSKSVGILLLLALGFTFAVNSSAATNVPTKKISKKSSVKTAKKTSAIAVSKPSSTAGIDFPENKLKSQVATVKPTAEKSKKSKIETHVDYQPETSKTFDSGILYGLDYYYRPSPHHTFRLYKDATQVLLPSNAPEDFVVGNTKLFYYYKFTGPETKDHSVAMRFLVTVGDSEKARKDGLNSVESIRLEFNKVIGGFTLGLRPYFSHYWSDYATDAKGEPTPLFGVGHNLLLLYSFNDKWSLGSEVVTAFNFLQPEEVKKAKTLAAAEGKDANEVVDTTKTSFNAIVELGYQATKAFAVRLGYAQEDKLVNEGKYGVEFLDKNSSRAYIGVDYTF